MTNVILEGVTKRFPSGPGLFRDLNLTVADGELVVLTGPSGSGKTTLLRLIAGLDDVDSGSIRIGSRVVTNLQAHERRVAMVFQRPALYPHWTVRRNLEFRGAAPRSSRSITEVAALLHLDALLERRPGQLSGGEQQRVALGRAMLRQPDVFLLDEPLSHLDGPLRAELRDELHLLHHRVGATMIYVTHDPADAWRLADRVVVLIQGQIAQAGSLAECAGEPADPWIARFLDGSGMARRA